MKQILEQDWKLFRKIHQLAVERFSKETLSQINQIIISKEIGSEHEKYHLIYDYIHDRNKMLEDFFDDLRRSTATIQILGIYNLGLIKPEEFNEFSDEIKNYVRLLNEL